jgi:hypothetical protein
VQATSASMWRRAEEDCRGEVISTGARRRVHVLAGRVWGRKRGQCALVAWPNRPCH